MPNSEMLELARLMETCPYGIEDIWGATEKDDRIAIYDGSQEWNLIIEALRIAGAVDKATTHDR